MLPRRAVAAWCLLLLLGPATVLAGCTNRVQGSAQAGSGVLVGTADTGAVHGSDGSQVDDLAAATLEDVQTYWESEFGTLSGGRAWPALSGGFYSVDTTDPDAPAPPCVDQPMEVEGNAYYCPEADAVAWDRAALFPVLREQHGDGGVVVVLAHEIGHAVHNRLGITPTEQRDQAARYPRILTEAMADCYAGSFTRWVVDGHAEHLRLDPQELDSALGALVTFRDPVGTGSEGSTAHGNAFDRVSSFQDGYRQGARFCAGFTVANRAFTQGRFRSAQDAVRGGNLAFRPLVEAIAPDLDAYFGRLVTQRGGRWNTVRVRLDARDACTEEQGPVAYCPGPDAAFELSAPAVALHGQIGDYATGTLLASRYGLAAGRALARSTEGDPAQRRALCLAGAYTGDLLARDGGFGLSPGDLDEAVQVLLGYDYASRDTSGAGLPSGFDRVNQFRAGALNGPDACPL